MKSGVLSHWFLYFLKTSALLTQLPAWTGKAGSNEVIMMKIGWSKADHSVFTNGIVFPLSLRLPISVFSNKTNRKKEAVKQLQIF